MRVLRPLNDYACMLTARTLVCTCMKISPSFSHPFLSFPRPLMQNHTLTHTPQTNDLLHIWILNRECRVYMKVPTIHTLSTLNPVMGIPLFQSSNSSMPNRVTIPRHKERTFLLLMWKSIDSLFLNWIRVLILAFEKSKNPEETNLHASRSVLCLLDINC